MHVKYKFVSSRNL